MWRRFSWWFEPDAFERERGGTPESAEEYLEWSRERQAAALEYAAAVSRARFPEVGGIIFWMGHDTFPCPINTSLIDYAGKPKPAAHRISAVYSAPDAKAYLEKLKSSYGGMSGETEDQG